ncbi:universal stress protein [Micromonospora sp. KC721]|uniref:universal stress protein n=1 Tax=Micromonospora sp. KC721 TaxID=2530380 RepID=UPI00104CAC04|nr:universal stress protein [Micromonospora sp. KC721]TDB78664.1 universal stress protein [Micromonospora sp. KC721]
MTASVDGPVVAGVSLAPHGMQVVRLAAQEAAAHRRDLTLLHAFNWEAAFEAPSIVGPRAEAEELIARASAVAHEVEPSVSVHAEIVEGPPVAALARRSGSAFLLAVGDGGMAHHAGCVPADRPAVQLAARAGCPVLVGRQEPPPSGPVLVGVDGSESAPATLEFALNCADRRQARLVAIRVVEPGHPDGNRDTLSETITRVGRAYPGVAIECHTVRGDPGIVLVEQSRTAQLTVVGARGDEPWRGMLGAVSQALLYHAPSPVIVVRGIAGGPAGGQGTPDARDQRP